MAEPIKIKHKELPKEDMHGIIRWSVPTIADLDTIPTAAEDVHKLAFVEANESYHVLLDDVSNRFLRVAIDPVATNSPYDNTTSELTAENVQAAIDEIDGTVDSHLASSTAHDADEVVFQNSASELAAVNVQEALDEIDTNLDDHISSVTAHPANHITFATGTSGLAAENVQAAIEEIASASGGSTGFAPKEVENFSGVFTIGTELINKYIRIPAGSESIVNIPNDTNINHPIGSEVEIVQVGFGGNCTFQGEAGVTINSVNGSNEIDGDMGIVKIKKVAQNQWDATGDVLATIPT